MASPRTRKPTMTRNKIGGLRSILYALARLLADVEAVERGPKAMERRFERRLVGKGAGRLMGKLVKK